jgi:tetratricopeptide (TPR) repeat protein
MAVRDPRRLLPLTPEQRRAAAAQFDRANQVLKTDNHEYGLQLLVNCCEIDPINPIYRQSLRQAQKSRYQNNLKGQPLAGLRAFPTKMKLRTALLRGHYVDALVLAERVFMRNPWDLATHLWMAEAFVALQQPDHALWTLEQIRAVHPDHAEVNRRLARLCEKRGNFTAAIALWNVVRRVAPRDLEAQNKAKDLAASATIAKGRYEAAINGDAPTPLVAMADDTAEQQATRETALPVDAAGAAAERQPREVAALRAKIQSTPNNVNAYLQLAAYYRRMDQPDQARAVLQQGMTATTNHFDLGQELIDLDIEPFRRDLAMAEERMHKESADSDLQAIRQKLVKEINTRELEYFRRRSDRFPTDTAARFEMSVRLLKAGQIDEAIREFQGIRNDPRFHGKVLFYLGFCFKNRKNSRLAQRNFEEALPHLGNDEPLRKEAMYQLAVGYADTGEIPRAVDLACELANLDYGYKDISALLDGWQAQARR